MAVGIYGSVRSSDIDVNDLDVFYTFVANREQEPTTVLRLTPSDVLTQLTLPTDEQVLSEENLLEGMYNLKLPANVFSDLGIYTIYIRPKQTRITIMDCGVLSALPTVKGIIIDGNDLDSDLTANNALQGYRIEYINSDGTKLRNTARYVVTSNKVVPVTENVGNTSQTAVRYRFDDSGNLLFLQVTPSSASNVKPNATPFIGNPDQTILISNTNVNPLAIEVEFVENTVDTLVNLVASNQIKDVDNGILTQYDSDNNIIRQFNLFEIKDDIGNVPLYEVKERRTNIDFTQNFDDIVSGI
ncbi:MAG: hypothetical protein HC836_15570 [Richelia sp. RM2_1_2]|nr:hypothetical protein [Richelia sp. RM2_1_2]